MTDPRPVVIGAGVIGCSIARSLAERGERPVVLDAGPAAGAGSTSASSAVVRYGYSTLDAVRLAWESKFHWEQWPDVLGVADELGFARLIRTGLLVLEAPTTPLDVVRDHFDTVGVPYEHLDHATLAARHPSLDLGRFFPPKRLDDPAFWDEPDDVSMSAYSTPDAGFVDDPALAAHNLMVAAVALGAEFRFRQRVTASRIEHGRMVAVTTHDGSEITASVVVNAAGPHSASVNRALGVPVTGITTRPLRQEVHIVPSPAGFGLTDGGVAVSDSDLGVYLRPHLAGTLMIGGLEPECDPLEWVDDPDDLSPFPTLEGWEAQTTRAARRLTSLGVPGTPAGLAALYDVTDDWMPIYDRSDVDGCYLAIGTSGNQFKNAPMVGPLMAALIDACEGGHDHDSQPVVVHGPHTGQPIDLGAFSRRRPLASTSHSVLG